MADTLIDKLQRAWENARENLKQGIPPHPADLAILEANGVPLSGDRPKRLETPEARRERQRGEVRSPAMMDLVDQGAQPEDLRMPPAQAPEQYIPPDARERRREDAARRGEYDPFGPGPGLATEPARVAEWPALESERETRRLQQRSPSLEGLRNADDALIPGLNWPGAEQQGPPDPMAGLRGPPGPEPEGIPPMPPQQLGDQGMSGVLQQGFDPQATADMGAFPPIAQSLGPYGPASPIDAGYSFQARPGKYPNEVIDEINQPALDRNAPYNPLPGNQQPSGQPGPANPFAGLGDAFGGPGNDQLASQLLAGQFGDRPRGGGGAPGLPAGAAPGGMGWAPGQVPAPNAPGGIPRPPRPRPSGGMSISAVPEGEEARTPRARPPQSWDPAGPSSIPDSPYGPGGVQPYGDVGGPRVPQASPAAIAREAARQALRERDTTQDRINRDELGNDPGGFTAAAAERAAQMRRDAATNAGLDSAGAQSPYDRPPINPHGPTNAYGYYNDAYRRDEGDDDDDTQASIDASDVAAAALGDTASTYSGGGEGDPDPGPAGPDPVLPAIELGSYILPEGSRQAVAHYDPKRHQHERIIYEDDPDYAHSPLSSYLDRGGAYTRDWGADPIVDDYLQGAAETRGFGALTGGKDAPVHLRGRNTGRIVGAVGGFLAPPGLLASAAGGVVGYKVGGKLGGWFGDRDKGAFTRFTNPGRVGRARDERGRLLDYTVDANGMYHYDNPSLNVVGAGRPVYTSIDQELEEGAPPPVSPILVVDHVAERQAQQDANIRDAQRRQDEDDRRNESMASSSRVSSPGGIWGSSSGLGFGGGRGYGGAAIGLGTGGAINPNR